MSYEIKYLNIAKALILNSLNCDKYAVFLFGSRARKNNSPMADIDVGIWGAESIGIRKIAEIKDLIAESIVPFDIDIVDFNSADEKFMDYALRKIEIWNYPKFLTGNMQILRDH